MAEPALPPTPAHAAGSVRAFPLSDVGLLPFLLTLPFLYAPKLLPGDTQPWVFLGAVVALFFFRPRQFIQKKDWLAIGLAVLSLGAYVARAGLGAETLRAAYIFLIFATLWMLGNRGGHNWFRTMACTVLVIWFLVGLYQYVAVRFGLPVTFPGRYVEGRSGVPSLAAEPSYFGSISVLIAMYLLHDRRRGDWIFLGLAVLNVLMSGSILAVLLLGFLFAYLRPIAMLATALVLVLLILMDASLNEAGLTARLAGFQSAGQGIVNVLVDPSLNLRAGQIWFTLVQNLLPELAFRNPVQFETDYNNFAAGTGILIPTESNFILPMAGELIYSGGLFGFAIVGMLILKAASSGPNRWFRFVRGLFVLACLLNPISIANPFLVFYVLQEQPCRRR